MNLNQFSFDPHIAAAIGAVGYSIATPIQRQAIPVILQGRDVLGTVQTGTKKRRLRALQPSRGAQNGN